MRSVDGSLEPSGTPGQPDVGVMNGGELELTGGFCFAVVPGDGNDDGVVSLVDYDSFEACISGPGGGAPDVQCSSFDFDGNDVVDIADFAVLQTMFAGPQQGMGKRVLRRFAGK